MNLEHAYVLADGLFARKVVKTIKAEPEYDSEVDSILNDIRVQMENALNARNEKKNYGNSNQKALQMLRAYGKAISTVRSLNIEDDEDCVLKYVQVILDEVNNAITKKEVKIKNLEKTLKYYEKIRYNAISQGSRFNINPNPQNLWQTVTDI